MNAEHLNSKISIWNELFWNFATRRVKVLPKCNFCMLLLSMLLLRSTFEQQLRYFHIANKSRVQHKEIVKHDQLWQLLQHSGHCSLADMHIVTLLTSPACNIAWVWLIDRDFRCQKRTLVRHRRRGDDARKCT